MKINVIIEKNENDFWGRIEGFEYLPVTVADSIDGVISNLKLLLADYIEHEGANDKKWKRVDVDNLLFDLHFDLRAFFAEYTFLNISTIAKMSGINSSLVRQYAKGIKHPSTAQAKKVEKTIHQLAEKMNNVSLVGSTIK
jgi:hypothetical protein